MAPITWKNVTAPALPNSGNTAVAAGSLLSRATGRLGNSLRATDLENFRRDRIAEADARNEASARAMAAMAGVTNLEDWNNVLANGGLEGLGFDPASLNQNAINFFTDRRMNLQNRRATDLTFEEDAFDFGVKTRTDERSEHARTMALEARDGIRDYAAPGGSLVDVRNAIANDKTLSAEQKSFYQKALGDIDESYWQLSTGAQEMLQDNPAVTKYNTAITKLDKDIQQRLSNDHDLGLYAGLQEGQFNNNTTVLDVIDELNTAFSEDISVETAGNLTNVFNDLVKIADRNNLPRGVVKDFIKNHISSNWVGWPGDQQLKVGDAEAEFKSFIERIPDLSSEYQKLANDKSLLAEAQRYFSRGTQAAGLAHDRGNEYDFDERATKNFSKLDELLFGAARRAEAFKRNHTTGTPLSAQDNNLLLTTPPVKEGEVDPRIDAFNNSDFIKGFRKGSADLAQGIDNYVVGPVASLTGYGLSGLGKGAGLLTGLVSPEAGSAILNATDAFDRSMAGVNKEGYIPSSGSNEPQALTPEALEKMPTKSIRKVRDRLDKAYKAGKISQAEYTLQRDILNYYLLPKL